MSANRIYFAQHGLAVNKTENPDRPLSSDGIKQTESVARQLQLASAPVSHIFHSGKLRAAQTAEIFASVLDMQEVSAIKQLSPNDEVQLLAQNLHTENALYVGHLPHLNKMVSYLVCGDEKTGAIQFQNSTIACLQKKDSLYQVLWVLSAGE